MKFEEFFDIEKFEYKWDYIETIPEFAVLKLVNKTQNGIVVETHGIILNWYVRQLLIIVLIICMM